MPVRSVLAMLAFLAVPLVARSESHPPPPAPRYLLPVFTDVTGAHGATFVSELRLFNAEGRAVMVQGIYPPCVSLTPCPSRGGDLSMGAHTTFSDFQKTGEPGLILRTAGDVRMNLRVRDTSRDQRSAGTEIPVIRESEMRTGTVALLGVRPEAGLFRNRLRIYSFDTGVVQVRFVREQDNVVLHHMMLDLNRPQIFPDLYPAFAETADFPVTGSPIRVEVEPQSGQHIWAFVTTTNNQTQEITIVTPQP